MCLLTAKMFDAIWSVEKKHKFNAKRYCFEGLERVVEILRRENTKKLAPTAFEERCTAKLKRRLRFYTAPTTYFATTSVNSIAHTHAHITENTRSLTDVRNAIDKVAMAVVVRRATCDVTAPGCKLRSSRPDDGNELDRHPIVGRPVPSR